jgi:hypothetical protein
MPKIEVRLGSYWIEVLVEDYTREYGSDQCGFCINKQDDFWALGMPAMRGYYIVHDYDTNKIGFAP